MSRPKPERQCQQPPPYSGDDGWLEVPVGQSQGQVPAPGSPEYREGARNWAYLFLWLALALALLDLSWWLILATCGMSLIAYFGGYKADAK